MKTDTQKRDAVAKMLAYIYAEWSKEITPALVEFWLDNLRGLNVDLCKRAARELVTRKTYGEPKFQDFRQVYGEIERRMRPKPDYNPWVTPVEDNQPVRIGRMIAFPEQKLLTEGEQ